MCICVCVCVCVLRRQILKLRNSISTHSGVWFQVCEGERKKEKEKVCVSVCVTGLCVSGSVCVSASLVCVWSVCADTHRSVCVTGLCVSWSLCVCGCCGGKNEIV